MKQVKEIKKRKDLITGKPGDWEVVGENFVYFPDFENSEFTKPPTGGWYEREYMKLFPEYFEEFKEKWNLQSEREIISLLREEEIGWKVREQAEEVIKKIKSDRMITVKGDLSGKEYEVLEI